MTTKTNSIVGQSQRAEITLFSLEQRENTKALELDGHNAIYRSAYYLFQSKRRLQIDLFIKEMSTQNEQPMETNKRCEMAESQYRT